MALFSDYTSHDGLGLAELVRSGAVHPRELVEAAIDRIDSLDADLNAVVGRRFEAALACCGSCQGDVAPEAVRAIIWLCAA